MPIEEDLKAEAKRLGFLLCGITSPSPTGHAAVYENWIAAGRHAGMEYLAAPRARQMRADPALIMPEARSVVVLGMRCPDPRRANPPPPAASQGWVAAYAWGDDYHEVIPARLRKLLSWLENALGMPVTAKLYTDTGPLLERDFAGKAGLGWIGKNTSLIHPQHGSYFLLAELFLSCQLQPDPPFTRDLCGSCTRCIDACPTGCILPDRTLDAGRCISYLTIENKGSIPPDLRPLIGNWIFGCDICQMVCPWNERFSDQTAGFEFQPRPGVPRPHLAEELRLNPQDFNRKFKNSPLLRAKRRGYLRNVAVALGNTASPADTPALFETLQSEPEPLVRAHAAWALGRIGSEEARAALLHASQVETDPEVRREIAAALEEE